MRHNNTEIIEQNIKDMKHRGIIVALLVIVITIILATACDPGFSEDVVIKNSSTHTLTVIPSDYSYYNRDWDSIFVITNKSYTIASGEDTVVAAMNRLGSASLEGGIYMFRQYYADSVILRFDNSRQVVYHKDDTTGISPYNFDTSNYSYEEKLHRGRTLNGHPYYGRLTFTVTDEHFDAANPI